MSKVTLFCLSVLMSSILGKTEAAALGEACTQNSDCTSSAVCDPRTKTCLIGVAGICTGNTDKCVIGAACTGTTGTTCACGAGYTVNDKLCDAAANKVGGSCTGSSCIDTHATCVNTFCQCSTFYQVKIADATCEVIPNKYGGSCSITDTTDSCVTPGGDANAKCSASTNGICGCKDNYAGSIGSICKLKIGQPCTSGGTACVDKGTCGSDNKCVCPTDYVPNADNTLCGKGDAKNLAGSMLLICIALLVKIEFF